MPRAKRKSFTEEQESTMVVAKSLGMPLDQICMLVGVSNSTLVRHLKHNAALQERMNRARAMVALTARQTLVKLATKKEDVNALKFYLQTQEGFRTTERVEHTGPDGRPIQMSSKSVVTTKDPTREEILAEMKEVQQRIEASLKGE